MDYSQYKFGVDIDNTLTTEKLPHYIDLVKTKEHIRNATPKQGIEILSLLCIKPLIITGRGSYYHDDTVYWLNKVNINYTKLFTVNKTEQLTVQQYIDYKVRIYVDNNIDYCLEDDVRVTNALKEYGIKCSIVEDDFEKAFWQLFK